VTGQGGVIGEVDRALEELIRREVVRRSKTEVSFGAPGGERTAATVHLQLYDIREDQGRRRQGTVNEYDSDGALTVRRCPPRYVRLSYLVTVWAPQPEEEHRLLDATLRAFLAQDAIPAERLTGSLADLGLPVPMAAAVPPPDDRALATALAASGAGLRPFVNVVISAPMMPEPPTPVSPPVTKPLTLRPESHRTGGSG
jgi:hypothetical protein